MSEIHILLVDDEPDILKWIKKDLESQAYIVYTAESGPKALDCIRNTTIDILITDIKMPGMDGVDLIKSARKHNPELHCIVFTGRGELHTARETIKLSVIDYLLKPVDKQELFDAVRKALEEKEKHRLAIWPERNWPIAPYPFRTWKRFKKYVAKA